jgi:asparagine synthase (glutamine-hydrolysing)
MCGIFGVIWHASENIPDEPHLLQTVELLRHRGPDDYGIYAEPGVGLAHTRLSLLDLNPRSKQPFWDRKGRYCLVYNGEIYNFAELRAELENKGVIFRTTSDTEVLLECLIHLGVEATLPRLEGMFAFGLYDTATKSLLLARDRFGIKPLFIYEADGMFIFASEVQAMRPWIKLEPDHFMVSSYLYGFSGPTKGVTFYRNVRILYPAGVVRVHKGARAEYDRFFCMSDFVEEEERDNLTRLTPKQAVDRLDQLLNQSVRAQLIADAPVGALCSGGLDSSLVMAIATRYHSNLAVFHANVVGPVSEYDAALRLARHLKLDLRAVEVRDNDFLDSIPEVTEHFGQPFYSCPHSVPYLMVSKLVRQNNVKAVLSGEAADEYFLGYNYIPPDIRKWLHVRPILGLIKRLLKPRRNRGERFEYFGPAYVGGGNLNSDYGLVSALHNRFEVMVEALESRSRIASRSNLDRSVLTSLDLLYYNLRALLHRNDSMGMAAGIEARFPFLDSKMAKFALNLSHEYKVRFSLTARDKWHYFFENKWILRKVAERYLPRELSWGIKKPFPINAYAKQRMQIAPTYFNDSFVAELFELSARETQCLAENSPHSLKWKLLLLDVWGQLCLRMTSREAMLSQIRKHVSISNPGYTVFFE